MRRELTPAEQLTATTSIANEARRDATDAKNLARTTFCLALVALLLSILALVLR